VVIYVGKRMDVSGRLNFQGRPQGCQVYFTDACNTTVPEDPSPLPVNTTVSRLFVTGKATMVAAGQNLRTYASGGRILGAVIADKVGLNNSKVEFDSGLLGRTFAMDSAWKLTGIHERGQ